MVCHGVVRLVPSNMLHIISTVVRSGLLTSGLPRCSEVGSIQRLHIISTVVRSGLPTGGLPRCREVGSIQHVFHGREVGFADRWFATMS